MPREGRSGGKLKGTAFFVASLSPSPAPSRISLVLVEQLLYAHEPLRPGPHGTRLGDGVHRFVAGRSGIGGGGVVVCSCGVARARSCCCCCSRCCSDRGRVRPWHQARRIGTRRKNTGEPLPRALSLSLTVCLEDRGKNGETNADVDDGLLRTKLLPGSHTSASKIVFSQLCRVLDN